MTTEIVCKVRIASGKQEAFQRFIANATNTVRTTEAGGTLTYQFVAVDSNSSQCLVHEAYRDRAALLAHFASMGDNLATALELFTVDELLIIGDMPVEIVAQLRAVVGDKLTHYSHVLSQL